MSHNDPVFRSAGIARRWRKTFSIHDKAASLPRIKPQDRLPLPNVSQFHLCHRRAKTGVVSISGISQHHTLGDASFTGALDLFQCDLAPSCM
jgi:hypothetical protein